MIDVIGLRGDPRPQCLRDTHADAERHVPQQPKTIEKRHDNFPILLVGEASSLQIGTDVVSTASCRKGIRRAKYEISIPTYDSDAFVPPLPTKNGWEAQSNVSR